MTGKSGVSEDLPCWLRQVRDADRVILGPRETNGLIPLLVNDSGCAAGQGILQLVDVVLTRAGLVPRCDVWRPSFV
jgi:hypothetical protein